MGGAGLQRHGDGLALGRENRLDSEVRFTFRID